MTNMTPEQEPSCSACQISSCSAGCKSRGKEIASLKAEAETLQKQVAMLHNWMADFYERGQPSNSSTPLDGQLRDDMLKMLNCTQATAEAFVREVEAKALEEAAEQINSDPNIGSSPYEIRDFLVEKAASLRATQPAEATCKSCCGNDANMKKDN